SLVREEKTENPPRLYDLTTLQREANRLYGYTAKQTLDYTQSLYEKKLCTYPRTDSQYLTDDMLPTAETIVSGLFGTLDFAKGVDLSPDYSRILNSKKVTDHHAIIPTAEAVKTDKGSLPESERNILLLLSMKLLSATAQPYRYGAVTASFSCGGVTFTAKGKTVQCE
ncbi:DNA topoisomerase, partial [uncultured Alistipes sp.]|uniref:DNA topoisomerase n=1 Tax=uncultured Alistipes sp. TaxID=538949 RepID=UPI0032207031